MLGRSHAILGFAATAMVLTGAGTNIIEDPLVFIPAVSVGTIASLLPDLDTANSTIRKTFKLGSKQTERDLRRWRKKGPAELVLVILRWWVARILDFIDMLLPHRGPTHYGITAFGLTLIVYWICQSNGWPWEFWAAFGAGYTSHLLGDGVTRAGIRLFAPFYPKFVHLVPRPLRIVTGTFAESIMLASLVGLMLVTLFLYLGIITIQL